MKKNKLIILTVIIMLLLIPGLVSANIKCNDGTYSPTCTYNHSGCCSRHGGVADNQDNYNNSASQNSESVSSTNEESNTAPTVEETPTDTEETIDNNDVTDSAIKSTNDYAIQDPLLNDDTKDKSSPLDAILGLGLIVLVCCFLLKQ